MLRYLTAVISSQEEAMNHVVLSLGASIDAVVAAIRELSWEQFEAMMDWFDYRGFGKSKFPASFIEPLLAGTGFGWGELQVEVVRVQDDLRDQVHVHAKATAYIYVLGRREHVDNPHLASGYLRGVIIKLHAGQRVVVPPRTEHGFTVEQGGILYFLSAQTPPIEGCDRDDYHLVTARHIEWPNVWASK